jgi:histidine phosphotransferase ChpT
MTAPDGSASPGGGRDEADLAVLVASRICHDIVSPVGAVRYGLELLPKEVAALPEAGLMRDAVETALARIEFFRLAFGDPGSGGDISADAMARMLTAAYADGRSSVTWEDRADRSRGEMRIACLGLNCIEAAAPRGAAMTVRRDGTAWAILAEAPRLKLDPVLWNALGHGEVPRGLQGAHVQFGLLARTARALGRPVSLTVEDRWIGLRV